MIQINPYNFVSLKQEGPDRKNKYQGQHKFHGAQYSGTLHCQLKAITPLISIDQRNFRLYQLKENDDATPLKIPYGSKKGQSYERIKCYKFLRDQHGVPILQGASLKGMVRSVYEAISNSCLCMAATEKNKGKNSYKFNDLGAYKNIECWKHNELCPACNLFGTVNENVHFQGRVFIKDAILSEGYLAPNPPLEIKTENTKPYKFLKELSGPKPRHHPTYGKNGQRGEDIAGRKFYYHHQNPKFNVTEQNSNDRSSAIDEIALPGCVFEFQIYVADLKSEELSTLLLAVELVEGMGHKIGLGKAIGLGSCQISINREKSAIYRPSDRYGSLANATVSDWYSLKADRSTLPADLIEVLRLNKDRNNVDITYPTNHNHYPKDPIDALGEFNGKATEGGKPDWAMEITVESPDEPPPVVKNDEEVAWLKVVYEKKLLFVTELGEERERPRHAFQGKNALLILGNWFILKGSNCVKPVK
ncbi:MAG: RAMP superfamily CRISPR-associated protein [Thermodesulfobacteriota bacterium]